MGNGWIWVRRWRPLGEVLVRFQDYVSAVNSKNPDFQILVKGNKAHVRAADLGYILRPSDEVLTEQTAQADEADTLEYLKRKGG